MATVLPEWFEHDCHGSLGSGLQLVEIQRHAEDSGLNGRILIDANGRIWIPADTYQDWTGQPAPTIAPRLGEGERWLPLDAIPHHVDACRARLQLAGRLPVQRLAQAPQATASSLPAATGAVLNLDLAGYAASGGSPQLHALSELGISTGMGYWRTRQLFQPDGSHRLDSQFRHDILTRGETVVLGDQLSGGSLADSVVFGGISWGSDFSQRPELPRYPLPLLSGDAVLSSVAELYVDGQLRQRDRLAPGPYQMEPLLIPQGFGRIDVITHDALGRETRLSQPFYTSSSLLRAGLDDYRINAGWLRHGMGSDNDHYAEGYASGDWRRGLNDQLTVGTHADAMAGRQGLQGEILASATSTGLSRLTGGVSRDDQAGGGYQIGASQEWQSRDLSLQGSWRHASSAFAEPGREPGAIATCTSFQAGLNLTPGVQASAGWLREQRRDRDSLELRNLALQFHLFSGSQWVISATQVPGTGWTHSLSLFQALPGRQSLALQLQQDSDGELAGQLQWAWQPDEHPWSLRADLADDTRGSASRIGAFYNGEYGAGSVGVNDNPDGRSLQGSLSTGLAWVPGNLFWSRRLNDSFIVVDAGEPGITLYRNNQIVGRTDSHGQLLVSDLQPYHPALLALGLDDLSLDAQPASLEQTVRPPRGAGRVDWRQPSGSRLNAWHARLDGGSLLPAGSLIRHNDESADLPSGQDGLLYIPAAWAGATLDITLPDGRRCHIGTLPADDPATEATCVLQP